jgi:hypothetical protein
MPTGEKSSMMIRKLEISAKKTRENIRKNMPRSHASARRPSTSAQRNTKPPLFVFVCCCLCQPSPLTAVTELTRIVDGIGSPVVACCVYVLPIVHSSCDNHMLHAVNADDSSTLVAGFPRMFPLIVVVLPRPVLDPHLARACPLLCPLHPQATVAVL